MAEILKSRSEVNKRNSISLSIIAFMMRDNFIMEKKYIMGKSIDRRKQHAVSPTEGHG